MNQQSTINIPRIISANTYFWSPGGDSSTRRWNEERRFDEVAGFLFACGFTQTETGDFERENVIVRWHYSESARNVYKKFAVYRGGKKSNLRGLAAELKKTGIEIV